MKKAEKTNFWQRRYKLRKPHHSIFVKLFFVIIITGILVNLLVGGFFKIVFLPHFEYAMNMNMANYANYLIKDLGIPPDPKKAKQWTEKYYIQIRFESPGFNWSSSENLPTIEEIEKRQRRIDYRLINGNTYSLTGKYRGRGFQISKMPSGSYLFLIDFIKPPKHIKQVIVLILILSLTLIGAYFAIKRLLKPIRWLMDGVDHVSSGNFSHEIPVKKKDELGQLSKSFNSMTKRISEMIHSKEQLLLDVSHELRSPLTRMKLALEFIPDDLTRDSLSEDVVEMEKMITEILESERLNSHYGKLNLQSVNVAELINDTAEHYMSRAPGLKVSSVPDFLNLTIDIDRIAMVLKNVIENALRYSQPDGKPVELAVHQDNDYLNIIIKDDGIGIPEDELAFIFEPFYRVDRSRSKDTGGYGLGMSLCKKFMEAHEGMIDIRSTFDVGTTVILRFPTAKK